MSNDNIQMVLLNLGQIVCMTEYAEASDICSSMRIVLLHNGTSMEIQSGHALNRLFEGILDLTFSDDMLHLLIILVVLAHPLVNIDCHLHSQWFGQHHHIVLLQIVRKHNTLSIHSSYGCPSYHRPRIINSLPASHYRLCFTSSLIKPFHHHPSNYLLFLLCHLFTHSQHH